MLNFFDKAAASRAHSEGLRQDLGFMIPKITDAVVNLPPVSGVESQGGIEMEVTSLGTKRRLYSAGLIVALLTSTAFAQERSSDFQGRHLVGVRANPPGMTLTLEIEGDQRSFRLGETIPLLLIFHLPPGNFSNFSRIDRDISGDETRFVFEDTSQVVDPFLRHRTLLTRLGGGIVGSSCGGVALATRIEARVDLNQWVRFVHPGRYRFFAETNELTSAPSGRSHLMTSSVLELEIAPAAPEWQQETLEKSLAAIQSADPNEQRRGCRALRYLDTRGSLAALLDQWPIFSDICSRNLFRAVVESDQDFAEILRQMDERIADPGYPVLPGFVGARAYALLLSGLHPIRNGMLQTANYQSATQLLRQLPLKVGIARAPSLVSAFHWDAYSGTGVPPLLGKEQAEALAASSGSSSAYGTRTRSRS